MPPYKLIHLTRHAQAEHNVLPEDHTILDAVLTPLGREQSEKLNERTANTIQTTAQLLVSSPYRRTIQTTLLGFPSLITRLRSEGGTAPILHPLLQETGLEPCDVGSARAILEAQLEFDGLDFSMLTDDWTSKTGVYAADDESLQARAKEMRRWLRDRPEREIVVVSHGGFLRRLAGGRWSTTPWGNTEVRGYTFVSATDEDAKLVPLSKVAGGSTLQ
jgi:broad specificity phosphatase PhoE